MIYNCSICNNCITNCYISSIEHYIIKCYKPAIILNNYKDIHNYYISTNTWKLNDIKYVDDFFNYITNTYNIKLVDNHYNHEIHYDMDELDKDDIINIAGELEDERLSSIDFTQYDYNSNIPEESELENKYNKYSNYKNVILCINCGNKLVEELLKKNIITPKLYNCNICNIKIKLYETYEINVMEYCDCNIIKRNDYINFVPNMKNYLLEDYILDQILINNYDITNIPYFMKEKLDNRYKYHNLRLNNDLSNTILNSQDIKFIFDYAQIELLESKELYDEYKKENKNDLYSLDKVCNKCLCKMIDNGSIIYNFDIN